MMLMLVFLLNAGNGQDGKREDSLLERNENDYYTGNQYTNTADGVDFVLESTLQKVNINIVDSSLLVQVGVFTSLEIKVFLNYRKMFGPFDDVVSLQAMPVWTQETFYKLLRLIKEQQWYFSKRPQKLSFIQGAHQLQIISGLSLNREAGYLKMDTNAGAAFAGGPISYNVRYRYAQPDLWQMGIVLDKDAGERCINTRTKQPDFISAHLVIQGKGTMKKVILGDYLVNMGQGLVMWESPAFGKGSNPMALKREQEILKPYRSVGEYLFERGIAMKWHKKNIEWDLFFSKRKHDATSYGSDSTGWFVQSLQTSGLHRTHAEIASMFSLQRTSAGSCLQFQKGSYHVGLNLLAHYFSIPWQQGTEPYRHFYPTGSRIINGSLDYAYTFGNAHFFGEEALNGKGFAVSNGLLLSVSQKMNLSFLHRSFSTGYQTLFDNAFQEGGKVANESGYYIGFQYKPNKMYEIDAYVDHFKFPWLQFANPSPCFGKDLMLKAAIQPTKTSQLVVRLRMEDRTGTAQFVWDSPHATIRRSISFMVHGEAKMDNDWGIRTNMELRKVIRPDNTHGFGFLFYTDFKYNPLMHKIAIECRANIFNTNQYDGSIYAFEPGVANTAFVQAYYDKGISGFLLVRWKPSKRLQSCFKLNAAVFWLKSSIGDGYDRVSGGANATLQASMTYHF